MGSAEAMQSIVDAVDMVNTYDFPQKPEILVASIRGPLQVVESIRAGAQIATVPYKTLEMLFHHPLTDLGIQRFTEDYSKALAALNKNGASRQRCVAEGRRPVYRRKGQGVAEGSSRFRASSGAAIGRPVFSCVRP